MANYKLSEMADLVKAAIENEIPECFGLEKLGIKLCINEEDGCIDVMINDLCLTHLFDFTLEAVDLHVYGHLIRSAAIIAICNYSRGRRDEAIEMKRIMEEEDENNG